MGSEEIYKATNPDYQDYLQFKYIWEQLPKNENIIGVTKTNKITKITIQHLLEVGVYQLIFLVRSTIQSNRPIRVNLDIFRVNPQLEWFDIRVLSQTDEGFTGSVEWFLNGKNEITEIEVQNALKKAIAEEIVKLEDLAKAESIMKNWTLRSNSVRTILERAMESKRRKH